MRGVVLCAKMKVSFSKRPKNRQLLKTANLFSKYKMSLDYFLDQSC